MVKSVKVVYPAVLKGYHMRYQVRYPALFKGYHMRYQVRYPAVFRGYHMRYQVRYPAVLHLPGNLEPSSGRTVVEAN